MFKMLGLIPRRADVTRAAFREYYETRHTPLALQYFRMFRKYLRNHLVPEATAELPMDVMSEFWFEDAQGAMSAGDVLASPAGEIIRADEANFMTRSGIVTFAVEESLLLGPPRIVEHGVVRKQAFFFRCAGDVDAALESKVRDCVAQAKGDVHRITLDMPRRGPQFPRNPITDGIVSVWPKAGEGLRLASVPAGVKCTELWMEAHETPTEKLSD